MLAKSLPFTPHADQQIDQQTFAQIPARPGVFILRPHDPAAEPYISKTSNLRRRIARLLARPEEAGISKRLNLRERCSVIEFTETGSEFENTWLLYRALRTHFPDTYAKRMRLAPPALIKFDWDNAYPRAYVTTRLGRLGARPTYYGPFRSRAVADKYANDVLDLFKSRRCTFELDPDPSFPGCVYSEMKMCLAPCFKGCTDEEYLAETHRAEGFFASHGESLILPLAAEREQASEALEFEKAKALHERVEKLKGIAREADELVHRIDRLDCIIVQPGATKDAVALFRFNGCQLCGPQNYTNEDLATRIESLAAPKKNPASECSEHLAIVKRWYYRSHRVGEIIFRNADGTWPLRKLANAIERVIHPRSQDSSEADAISTQHPERSEGSL